ELLSEGERSQLQEWNRTTREYPRERCVHELFEEQAERRPEAVAVACGEQRLTYAELSRRSEELAWQLRGQGVGPASRVGMGVERSLETVVGLLGILKAGGAYVPLDPAYPKERLAYMAANAGVEVVVTESRLRERLPEGVAACCLDEAGAAAARIPRAQPSPA